MARTTYEEINIGPFTGGLNLGADSSSIGDLDLAECLNLELDTDGALVSRPGYYSFSTSGIASVSTASSVSCRTLIGWYTDNAVNPAKVYAILSNNYNTVSYMDMDTGVGGTIATGARFTSAVQVSDTLYILSSIESAGNGYTWKMAAGTSTATADATIPHGEKIVNHKNRLWVIPGLAATANGSVVKYSTPTYAWSGTGSGQFTVVAGPGENLVDIMPVFGDLVLFKANSTHKFSYSSDVGMGEVQTISNSIGSSGPKAVTTFENQIYVLHKGSVYDLTSYVYTKINTKLPLTTGPVPTSDLAWATTLTAWANRLFVGYYGNVWVYSLLTRTWSEWSSTRSFLPLVYGIPNKERPNKALALPAVGAQQGGLAQSNGRYGWPSGAAVAQNLYIMSDTTTEFPVYNSSDSSTFEPNTNFRIRTKDFDYQTPTKFKRLRFWGAEVFSKLTLTMTLTPLQYASVSTWNEVAAYTWDQLGTWGRLIDKTLTVTDSAGGNVVQGGRKWVKFIKSLRFRATAFTVSAVGNMSADQLPFRIYSLTTYVKEKSLVPKKIN